MTESASEEGEAPLFHLFQKNGQALLFAPGQRLAFRLDAASEVAARAMLGQGEDVVVPPAEVSAEEVARAEQRVPGLATARPFLRSSRPVRRGAAGAVGDRLRSTFPTAATCAAGTASRSRQNARTAPPHVT